MSDSLCALFVDDSPEYVQMATDYFEQEVDGITLVGETDVAAAMDRLTEPSPDVELVVSDYQMPRTNGLEFLDAVREVRPGLPFVLLTAQGSEELAAAALHRGVSDYLPKGSGTDHFDVLANRIENLVGRSKAERSLRAREAHLEALATAFPDLAFLLDADGRYLEYFVGEHAESLLYAPAETLLGRTVLDVLPGSVADTVLDTIRTTLETGRLQTVEYELAVVAGSRWFEARVAPVDGADGADSVVMVSRDVTERRHRERVVERLHEATRELMAARTDETVADRAVAAADRMLEFAGTAIYLFDDATASLRPAAHVEAFERLYDGLPTFGKGESVAWEVFLSGDSAHVADVRDHEGAGDPEAPIRSVVLVPLGDHGVLVAGSTTPNAFGETDVELLHLLASNTEAALDRTRREARLRERERTLSERNEELRTVNHLNAVLRDVGRTITSGTTREEVQRAACEQLADVERYTAAWLREVDTVVADGTPDAWAGLDAEFFDAAGGPTTDAAPERALCDAAVESRTVQVARNVLELPEWEGRRRSALSYGFRSVAAVPLVDGEYVFSVLVLYAEGPEGFGEREVGVLAEGGRVLGHTIDELQTLRALVTDSTLELEIGVDDSRWFPARLSAQADCRVEVGGILPRSDGTAVVFVTTRGVDPERVREVAVDWTACSDASVVVADAEESLVELVVELPELVEVLHTYGASLQSVEADGGESTVTVGLPPKTDVRSLLSAIEARYPESELRSRHERTDPLRSRGTLKAELVEALTERQYEVLQVAYYGGYFDPDRKSTGEQLAAMLDISGPTFHKHLRSAQRKLLAATLDGGATP